MDHWAEEKAGHADAGMHGGRLAKAEERRTYAYLRANAAAVAVPNLAWREEISTDRYIIDDDLLIRWLVASASRYLDCLDFRRCLDSGCLLDVVARLHWRLLGTE